MFPGSREELVQFLESKNYQFVGNLFDDIFVRKDLLGVKYNIDLNDVEREFPLFSSDRSLQSLEIIENFLLFWGDIRRPLNGETSWSQYIRPRKHKK